MASRLAGFYGVNPDDKHRLGDAASALAKPVRVLHEGSHGLKSVAWACTRVLRMEHNFENDFRMRYLNHKWGPHWNASIVFPSVHARG